MAKPTFNEFTSNPYRVNAVVAKDAVDAVPVKLPTKVTVLKPGFDELIIPVVPSIFIPVFPPPTPPTVVIPLTFKLLPSNVKLFDVVALFPLLSRK